MDKPADTHLPLLDVIAQRWSPRAFDPERVPSDEQLAQIFEAARWAASSYNEQPWRYLLATRDDGPLYQDALAGLNEFNRSWAATAPVVAFSLARRKFSSRDSDNPHAWHDVGAASAQLSLQAASLGIMVHQMAGIVREEVRSRFAVPEDFEVVAGIVLGWPGDPQQLPDKLREREAAPRTRRAREELVIRGRFG
jgi:nitroreductase